MFLYIFRIPYLVFQFMDETEACHTCHQRLYTCHAAKPFYNIIAALIGDNDHGMNLRVNKSPDNPNSIDNV